LTIRSNFRVTLTIVWVLVFMALLNCKPTFQIAVAQEKQPRLNHSIDNASGVIPVSTAEAEKHSTSMSVVKKAEVQHPISHENTTTEQLVNQTLNMLKPIERAINESHNCIIEAVICGNSTLANKPMLRL
jgi:hypothetical protein